MKPRALLQCGAGVEKCTARPLPIPTSVLQCAGRSSKVHRAAPLNTHREHYYCVHKEAAKGAELVCPLSTPTSGLTMLLMAGGRARLTRL